MKSNRKGVIFNIQKFSVHDGPSIRDLVFLKGCPLRCVWCSNPESQNPGPELGYNANKCIGTASCGTCMEACRQKAIGPDGKGRIQIDRNLCRVCRDCEDDCCARALTVFGKEMTVDEVLAATLNQERSWRCNGGVTLSGGEPLMQADFCQELLREYCKRGIHTAIETTGRASWGDLSRVARYCQLIFYDVKLMDEEKHRKYTGVGNRLILENLFMLSKNYPEKDLIVRTPVIPGINDSKEELGKIAAYLKTLPHLTDYELLPYHAFGSGKYGQIGRKYFLEGVKAPEKAVVSQWNEEYRKEILGEDLREKAT